MDTHTIILSNLQQDIEKISFTSVELYFCSYPSSVPYITLNTDEDTIYIENNKLHISRFNYRDELELLHSVSIEDPNYKQKIINYLIEHKIISINQNELHQPFV